MTSDAISRIYFLLRRELKIPLGPQAELAVKWAHSQTLIFHPSSMWSGCIAEHDNAGYRPSPPPSPSNYHVLPANKNSLRDRVSKSIHDRLTKDMALVNSYERSWLDAQETVEGQEA